MHPRMDAALEPVFPFAQARYLDGAALNDSGLGDVDCRKAADAFRCYSLAGA